jgi:hypothetical protein
MGRIKDYFLEQGLTPADFPVAFVFHEVISIGWAGAVWGACYGIEPSVTLCKPFAKLPVAGKVSGAFQKALQFSDAKLEKMTWLKKMPVVKNAAPRRLTVSLAESLMFRGAVKPISFGAKLYFSYQFVLWTKKVGARWMDLQKRKEEEQANGTRPVMVRKNGRWVRETPAALTLALPSPRDGRR